MTRWGIYALWANVALSLMFGMWGIAVYVNRVEYADKKTGEFGRREAVIKDVMTTRDKSVERYNEASKAHKIEEARVPALRSWQEARLESLRTGKDKQPVLALDFQKGELQHDAKGYPKLTKVRTFAGNKEVTGLADLAKETKDYLDRQDEIKKTEDEIARLLGEEEKLTKIIGDGTTGLRLELAKRQDNERRSLAEQEFLKPLLYNAQEDLKVIVARRKQLEDRLDQLKKATVAQGR